MIPAGERIPSGDPSNFLTKYSYKQGNRKEVLCAAIKMGAVVGKAAAAAPNSGYPPEITGPGDKPPKI